MAAWAAKRCSKKEFEGLLFRQDVITEQRHLAHKEWRRTAEEHAHIFVDLAAMSPLRSNPTFGKLVLAGTN
jgi:hypothetical protein